MRVQICSDLHLEFGQITSLYDEIVNTPADILVLSGDISGCDNITDDLVRIQEDSGKRIIFVSGNHEYYGTTRRTLDKELKYIKHINNKIHVLIEDDICIGGVVFIGSTGWWDESNGSIGLTVQHGLNDFRMIYDLMDEKNLNGIAWGRKSKTFLASKMHYYRHNHPDMRLCVVTHHYPHPKSLSPKFEGSPLNVCFGNRWEDLIEQYKPELWIHGHTHDGFDYMVDKTRIICNPQGYPLNYENGIENSDFNPNKVVTL